MKFHRVPIKTARPAPVTFVSPVGLPPNVAEHINACFTKSCHSCAPPSLKIACALLNNPTRSNALCNCPGAQPEYRSQTRTSMGDFFSASKDSSQSASAVRNTSSCGRIARGGASPVRPRNTRSCRASGPLACREDGHGGNVWVLRQHASGRYRGGLIDAGTRGTTHREGSRLRDQHYTATNLADVGRGTNCQQPNR